jgi:D-inositol-3-phosphate glycosyltransferase
MYRVAIISYHTCPVAPLGGPETGGLNVYVRELSRELAERGHHVDVFTRRAGDVPAAEPALVDGSPHARLMHIDAGPAKYVEKALLPEYLDQFEQGILAFAAREGVTYDIVHSHYWLSGLVGERLKARWGVPHMTMFHTLAEVKSRSRISEWEPDVRIESEHAIVQAADCIIAAGTDERDLLVRLYDANAERIAVVPCGVNLDLFQPVEQEEARRALSIAEHERILLFVGRVEPLKGIDILLGAAAELAVEHDCIVMVVGGDNTAMQGEMSYLRTLAKRLGIADRVRFLGAVDHQKLPLYYSAADVCVVPSFYESFGLVALEAMACGTPVVASRVGGLAGTVRDGETGYLIPWRCPEPFAERIELLLGNEELRRAFGRTAREAVERFRWSNVADQVIDLYRRLIDRVPAPTTHGK